MDRKRPGIRLREAAGFLLLTALMLLGVGLWIAGLIQGKPEEPALRACLPLLPWLG